jgi:tRNA dimethylallyltransferase
MGLAEAAAIAQRDTRRYAKRQFTWMAGQMAGWPNTPSIALEDRMVSAITARDAQK